MKKLITFLSGILITVSGYAQSCNSEFAFTAIQETPLGLATDGTDFWVGGRSGFANYSINRHDEFGNFIETIFTAESLWNSISGLELQEDTLWMVQEQVGALNKINKYTGELYDIFDLPTTVIGGPNNWGIAYDGEHIWNVEYWSLSSVLYKINTANGSVLDTIDLEESLLAIEFVNGKMLGVSRSENKLYEINLETGELSYIIAWCLDDSYGIAFNPDGDFFGANGSLFPNGNQSVNRIIGLEDLATGTISNIETEEIKITPNPTIETLNVYCPEISDGQVIILNSIGETCLIESFKNNKFERNIEYFAEGLYYVQLNDGMKSVTEKFVKIK